MPPDFFLYDVNDLFRMESLPPDKNSIGWSIKETHFTNKNCCINGQHI